MPKRSRRLTNWKHQPEVNLNSFLDLVLNVLLFFIFATEIAAFHALEVTIPSSSNAKSESHDKSEIIIYITRDNKINIDGQEIKSNDLANWLNQNKGSDNDQKYIIVRGDLNSELQTTVDVLSACRAAHINKIKVETKESAS